MIVKPRVVVFGAGVAGLTAGSELVQRGFEVHIVERLAQVGGRAASQIAEATPNRAVLEELGVASLAPLPGEHGFRFFPSFYKHLTDTMERIPLAEPVAPAEGAARRALSAADNLVPAGVAAMGFHGAEEMVIIERRAPRSITAVLRLVRALREQGHFTLRDIAQYELKIFELMTSCDERRCAALEPVSWWDFVHGVGSDAGPITYSPAFDRYIETGPKLLVAMSAREGAAKAQGEVLVQMLLDQLSLDPVTDRVMNGPTNRQWIDPWRAHLEREGVRFHRGELGGFALGGEGPAPTFLGAAPPDLPAPADVRYYVLALAIEDAQRVLFGTATGTGSPALIARDATENADAPLAALANLSKATAWMSGVQLYLRDDVEIARGHIGLPDSPWGISLISQGQFWGPDFVTRHGQGVIRTILSIDIGDFDVPGLASPPAKLCTKEQFVQEVWNQIAAGLRSPRFAMPPWPVLAEPPRMLIAHHVDANLDFSTSPITNRTPMFINPPGSWPSRPGPLAGGYRVRADKLLIAGEYTQTHTGLPCMESANESARHAVNAILDDLERKTEPARQRHYERCAVWPLAAREPDDLAVFKELDRKLFARGVPHASQVLGWQKLLRTLPEDPGIHALELMLKTLSPLLGAL